jgi:hypothetical protein
VPDQGGRAGVDGGAHVEQQHPAVRGGQDGGEGRAADAGPAAEAERGGAHHRSGGAGGDDGVGVPVGDRPYGGADRVVRVGGQAQAHPVLVRRVEGAKEPAGHLTGADEQQMQGRVGLACPQSAVNHDGGCVVPAEEVDGDPRGARLHGRAGRGNSAGARRSRNTGRTPLLRSDPPDGGARHWRSGTQTSMTWRPL